MEQNNIWVKRNGAVLTISIRVTPRARRSRIEGIWNGTHVRIALQAPPVDGQANVAVTAFLAALTGVRKGDVDLLSGATGRCKIIRITYPSDTAAEAAAVLLTQMANEA